MSGRYSRDGMEDWEDAGERIEEGSIEESTNVDVQA